MKKLLYISIVFLLLAPLWAVKASPDLAIADSLVKGSLPAVYYYASDGKRYVFPNDKTYKTWFKDFSSVTQISDQELASMQIGGNVTYRPGVKMIKIQSDPKVYAVEQGGMLRWVATEIAALYLYGENWNQKIDDVSDAFFTNYKLGAPIESASDFSPGVETLETRTINSDKDIEVGANPLKSDTITLAPLSITIISITPDQMLNSIENYLTITGIKFSLGARVFIGTTQSPEVSFINNSTLKAKVPAGLEQALYSVQVINPNGTTVVLRNALDIIVPPEPELDPLSLLEIFEKVAPSVVQVAVDVGDECPCLGSGVIIDTEGYILTNYHVIEGDEVVEIKLFDDSVVSGEVLGWSELRDLALIKISSSYNNVELADYSKVREGDTSYSLGYPGGGPVTNISQGVILARGQVIDGHIYALTDSEIQHGSSGGPLVDNQGDVIGIVRGGLTIPGTDSFYGYNFAIPIDIAQSLLPDLKNGVRTLNP
ncbi:MAG: trypsin-like peptidase domain-containing protein [Patescibacteria group bacterium]|nr:trypsin-like peptidase domain-containing protein [Patescibacteria group bacterium]